MAGVVKSFVQTVTNNESPLNNRQLVEQFEHPSSVCVSLVFALLGHPKLEQHHSPSRTKVMKLSNTLTYVH